TEVYISEGTYDERVTLQSGISLYGGYSQADGWTRSISNTVVIQSGAVSSGYVSAMVGVDIQVPTTVDRLSIKTLDTSEPGVSNYGILCNGCNLLKLSGSTVIAGSAGPGTAGLAGAVGITGGNGGM